MLLLEGKRIVVTGGSMGVGLAVAQRCAGEGASLTLIARHEGDLKNAISTIKHNGQNHTYYCLDVGESSQVAELAAALRTKHAHIDGLVNCAGIYGPIGKLDDIDPADFASTLRVNLLGTFYMCHYLVPLLRKSRKGKIVNYSGGGAAGPFPNYSAYSVSKTGIVRLTENMAIELKEYGIDVNAVAPGFVVTRLHQETIKAGKKAGEDFLKKTLEQIDKGGVSPDIAAKLTVFLLSQQSDGVTGKFISAPWDLWETQDFVARLKTDPDFAVLRRIDNKRFFKISDKSA